MAIVFEENGEITKDNIDSIMDFLVLHNFSLKKGIVNIRRFGY